jgi:hypothetical protein
MQNSLTAGQQPLKLLGLGSNPSSATLDSEDFRLLRSLKEPERFDSAALRKRCLV